MPKPRSPADIIGDRILERIRSDPKLVRIAQGAYFALKAAENPAALLADPEALAAATGVIGVTAEELWEFNAVLEEVENEQLRT